MPSMQNIQNILFIITQKILLTAGGADVAFGAVFAVFKEFPDVVAQPPGFKIHTAQTIFFKTGVLPFLMVQKGPDSPFSKNSQTW